jgi:hypothetical protein
MKLQTPVADEKCRVGISYNDKIMMLGSCFSDNIGARLSDLGFDVCVNPFGTLYNPASIASSIERLVSGEHFTKEDCIEIGAGNHRICSFSHHTSFSGNDEDEFLAKANSALDIASGHFRECSKVIITLGTSWCYRHIGSGSIVSNCLKHPASEFQRERLCVQEISALLKQITETECGRKKEFIFTVSPIRHWRDGAHDNQISKSSLLLSIEEIQDQWSDIHYFPAYEIMMDELRDYRFYAEDMIHPNTLAINYIWEKFCEFSFDNGVKTDISEIEKVARSVAHKPLNPESPSHKKFKANTLQQIEELQKKFPAINFQREREQLL